jgi:hypothetical protein
MPTLSRSSVLLVGCLLLRTTASAQGPAAPVARPATPATELLIADARWVPAVRGAVPPGSVAHGRERDGRPQYICRTTYDGGLHLGKVSPGSAGCLIAAHGSAVVRVSYHVLTELHATDQDVRTTPPGRRSRWGRSESVVDLIRRRHEESGRSQKSVHE